MRASHREIRKRIMDRMSKISDREFFTSRAYRGYLTDIKALSFLMYELNEAYSSKYGYYIYEDDELQPLPEWLRAADPQAIYHIGNVLDYHF